MNKLILIAVFVLALLLGGAGGFLLASTRHNPLTKSPQLITALPEIIPPIIAPEPAPKITLLVIGDMMLDRSVRRKIAAMGFDYLFTAVPDLFAGQDIVVANTEGSFTKFTPNKNPHTFSFTFNPEFLPRLHELGFNFFGLANNHALNFGAAGLAQTKKFLTDNKINYFGDPQNKNEMSMTTEIRGQKIAFIGYEGLDAASPDTTIAEIKKLRPQVDYLIVFPHWGTEYELKFTPAQQKLAHQFVDAGADMIIGTHPHVVEPLEIYQNKMIFYSLGNFIFDQTFSADTQMGLAVNIELSPDQTIFQLTPTQQKNIQLTWPDDAVRTALLKRIADNSVVSPEQAAQILTGTITLP